MNSLAQVLKLFFCRRKIKALLTGLDLLTLIVLSWNKDRVLIMDSKTAVIWGAVVLSLMGVVGLTVYLLQSQQDVRSRAQTTPDTVSIQQSCPTPAQVQNVQVEFPNCVGDICNFTQASCTWSSVSGATKYQLKISQVESGEVVRNEQIEAAVTKVEFPIVQNKTYKCEVSAINSCGSTGVTGYHSLLCAVDALVVTPTLPPPKPTSTPIPTPTPIPTLIPTSTSTPQPTIPPVGGFKTSIAIGLGTVVMILTGIALLAL